MTKFGRNHGRYLGECIDIYSLLDELAKHAKTQGWFRHPLLKTEALDLAAYSRPARRRRAGESNFRAGGDGVAPPLKFYLSSGIHGDEPAGPLALLELFKKELWPDDFDLSVSPCLNPAGFLLNQRENAEGIDLNRDYRHLRTREVCAHAAWLNENGPFDFTLLLHEDWEANGFYMYELKPERWPSPAESMLQAVSKVAPIETAAAADGWEMRQGIIRPRIAPEDRADWPEALFLIQTQTRHSITLEAPSDYPIEQRVAALVEAVKAALDWVRQNPVEMRET